MPIATNTANKIHVKNDHSNVPTEYRTPILSIFAFQISALFDSSIIVNAGKTRNVPKIIKNHPNHSGNECVFVITNCKQAFQLM